MIRHRRALLLLVCVLVAPLVFPMGSARAQEQPVPPADPCASLRDDEKRLDELTAQAEATDVAILGLQTQLAETATQRGEILDRLVEAGRLYRVAIKNRDDADALGRQVAVAAYVTGRSDPDPLMDMLGPERSSQQLVRRALFGEIRAYARQENRNHYKRAQDLADSLQETRFELVEATTTRNDLLIRLSQAHRDRLETREELRELAAQLDRILELGIRHPLTGITTDKVRPRPAVAVKIDNAPQARPQAGLSKADLIFEEKVEGNITRFVAVFQSRDPGVVGPVRSARTSDFDILSNLGCPLFVNSGGNANVLRDLAFAPVRDAGATRLAGPYSRDGSRSAPHNLFADTDAIRAAFADADPPPFAYEYLLDDEENVGTPVSGVSLDYGGVRGVFRWDGKRRSWLRSTDGVQHNDAATGEQVGVRNVVVQFTEYRPSSADIRSPEAITVGSGPAWVFSDGQLTEGRWERTTPDSPTFLRRDNGKAIRLQPGTTWVALPEPGRASVIR